ncbi:MAG TPA: VOC family protein [Stellaceae bacterium]|nr:VOC family protein [Stellaceae bacterium]
MRDIDVFHHIGLVGRDLAALSAQIERLGFLLTPLSMPEIQLRPGAPNEPVGVGNRCAILENSYLELLGVVDPARWDAIPPERRGPYDIDRALVRYEGLHVMHFGTGDLDAVRVRLAAAGFEPSPIRPFQRIVDTQAGPATMRARTLSLPREDAPEALFQVVQHETPELVLQRRYMAHDNGARTIDDVILCVADPDEAAARYARIAGKPVLAEGATHRIDLGRSSLVIANPEGLATILPGAEPPKLPFLAGFSVTAEQGAASAFFARRGIPITQHRDLIIVRPDIAGGAFIRFKPAAPT